MTIKRLKRVKRMSDISFVRKGQKSAITERTAHICYVCNKDISGITTYITGGLFRHDRCAPGSARWLASARARVSGLTEFFEREEK